MPDAGRYLAERRQSVGLRQLFAQRAGSLVEQRLRARIAASAHHDARRGKDRQHQKAERQRQPPGRHRRIDALRRIGEQVQHPSVGKDRLPRVEQRDTHRLALIGRNDREGAQRPDAELSQIGLGIARVGARALGQMKPPTLVACQQHYPVAIGHIDALGRVAPTPLEPVELDLHRDDAKRRGARPDAPRDIEPRLAADGAERELGGRAVGQRIVKIAAKGIFRPDETGRQPPVARRERRAVGAHHIDRRRRRLARKRLEPPVECRH